ncbi:Concanavalin A-like lectin/glucanase superfamily [Cynara cardunculus var. scolymus]|uniref:xyloglucan:xyloglucosyl transferase n=1 Tax=Cynara cardunculus var. scolymus TaxID=59895 RepID=A0A103XNT6_CYNCS|nr:Concanavalin A-like lectin/glucanase superfamily [Cynara cardunculus var. scolymus]
MGSRSWQITTMMVIFFEIFFLLTDGARDASFGVNYNVTWGRDRILFFKRGLEVQLSLDHLSGSGFASKAYFGSGLFQMKIKLPDKDSSGVVTAFYVLTITLNAFVNYFLQKGYPKRPMQVVVSLWDGSAWATDGGQTKANWSNEPFKARFQDFNIDGCPSTPTASNMDCYSSRYWWNHKNYLQLDQRQLKAYEDARKAYMNYDYCTDRARDASFDENYNVTWGRDRILFFKRGHEVQLSLDHLSGSGFASKAYFGSGLFQMKIKLPDKDSAGVVTAFYVLTKTLNNNKLKHDVPIRVLKKNRLKGIGYPKRAMQVVVSLWDGSDWATDGGQSKANWSNEPFQAHFQDFNIDGCPSIPTVPNKDCYSSRYWWNRKNYRQLNQRQLKAYEDARKVYMNYDYCTDRGRYPIPHPECTE